MKRFWMLTLLLTAVYAMPAPLALAIQDDPEPPANQETPQEETQQDDGPQEEATEEEATQDSESADDQDSQDAEAPEAAAPQEEPLQSEVVADNLNNPCGLAISPESRTLYVADSGNLKISRLVDGKLEDVITDFPRDVYGKGPKYAIGPLGLCFLDETTLVVGGGGLVDGEELLRVYKVPAVGEAPIKADQMESSMALPAEGETVGEGNFYALVATELGVYATLNGDDTKGWIGKATREGNQLKDLSRYIATKESTDVDAPVGICMTPDGFLAIGQMGEITEPGDSQLLFFSEEGKCHGIYETVLSDITSLTYSEAGHLYALDFSWHDISKGGLFRLVADGDMGCIAKPMLPIEKPTAMVFDKEGNLWITAIGTADDESQGGQLLKVSGLPTGRQ